MGFEHAYLGEGLCSIGEKGRVGIGQRSPPKHLDLDQM